MVADRNQFEFLWQLIARNVLPMRPRGCIGDGTPRLSRDINNGKATRSQRRLRAVVQSELMSPSSDWYELTTGIKELDEDKETAVWLRNERDGELKDLDQSNAYTEADLAIGDSANFGTGTMLMEESITAGVRCTAWPIGSFSIGVDDEGKVNRAVRDYTMTVGQIVTKFAVAGADGKRDLSKLPPLVRESWDKKEVLKTFPVSHMIYPNDDWNPQAAAMSLPVSECYWSTATPASDVNGGVLREGGFNEFPLMVPRWEVAAGDIYGTSCPGIVALPDVLELQAAEADYMRLVALLRKAPVIGPPGIRQGGISLLPGAVNEEAAQGASQTRPLIQINPQALVALEQKIARLEAAIDEAYHADIAAPNLDNTRAQPDTAAAVYAKSDERASMLGPVVTRWDDDFSDPLITRLYSIRLRNGRVAEFSPAMKKALQAGELKVGVRLVSKMAVAQRSVGLAAQERLEASILNSAAIVPQTLDVYAWDEGVRQKARMLGVAPATLNSTEETATIRAQRLQQQAAEQKLAMQAAQAKTAKDLAAAKFGQNSALDALQQQGAN